jgi:heme-degrading monooxygenase HmoA
MIARVWRGRTTTENADAYLDLLAGTIFPGLAKRPGHCAAYVMRRPLEGGVEFVVTTLWFSMDAIRQFAGENADAAVVEPRARELLDEYDDFVSHYDLVYRSEVLPG